MSFVTKPLGSLRARCLRRPCSSSRNLTNLLRCIRGQVILHWRSVDASWMAISYESMKLNGCQRRRPTHRHSTSLGDVATLVGVAQDQGVHKQCVLKVLWDTCASERQAIAVAQYIGAYESGFDPESGQWQYGVSCAKWTGRVPSNKHHMNSCG
jgi:hypothetical protein